MPLSWLTGWIGRNAKRSRQRRQPSPTLRPVLESLGGTLGWGPSPPPPHPTLRPALERLEERLAPAGTFTWKGGAAGAVSAWTNGDNWNRQGVTDGRDYPGQNNILDDDVRFTNESTQHPAHLATTITVKSLVLQENYTGGVFEIQGGNGLTVRRVADGDKFEMRAGTLNLKGGSWLALNGNGAFDDEGNPAAPMVWSGGDLSKDGDANAKIYVHDGTAFTIDADATQLGATLVIGESRTGAPQTAAVNIARADGTGGLSGNLTLHKNANIEIKTPGFLNLNQRADSGNKGGIVAATGSTSAIDNKGWFKRTRSDDNLEFLTIGIKVTNTADGARIRVENNGRVNFAALPVGADVTRGKFEVSEGDVKGKIKGSGTGKISVEDPGAAGQYEVSFLDDLTLEGGTFEFIQTTPGAYGTVNIGGNFTLAAGTTLDNLHLGFGTSDRLAVSGAVTLGGDLNIVLTSDFVGGEPFTVIDNLSPDPVDGYFANLPPGAQFPLGDWLYEITYEGGDDNDVVLLPISALAGTVGDRVWHDLNGNGVQDDGEPGVADVLVHLIAVDSSYFADALTDGSGNYLFTDVPPNDYYLQFDLPDGYLFTQPYQGDPAFDSDADPSNGTTAVFTLTAGQVDPNLDAGLVSVAPPDPASVGDLVWHDLNGNGLQDEGEPGLALVLVQLIAVDGSYFATAETDETGHYLFTDVPAGTYNLLFIPPPGYGFTQPYQGDSILDSDADPSTGYTAEFTVLPGSVDLTLDAGLIALS